VENERWRNVKHTHKTDEKGESMSRQKGRAHGKYRKEEKRASTEKKEETKYHVQHISSSAHFIIIAIKD